MRISAELAIFHLASPPYEVADNDREKDEAGSGEDVGPAAKKAKRNENTDNGEEEQEESHGPSIM